MGRRQAEGSGGACSARLRGGSLCSSRLAASSSRKGPSAWGAAKQRAQAVLAERDFGAARHAPLASPLVQEEGGRRLGAPPSRGLGRCLHSATSGRLAMFLSPRRWFKKKGAVGLGRRQAEGSGGACRARLRGGSPCSSRFAASSRRRGPSAWGAVRPRARAALAVRDFGAARHVPLASPLVQEEGGRWLGAPPSRGLGRCLQCSTWGRLAMFLSLRRKFKKKGAVGLGRRQAEGSGGACSARLRGGSTCSSRFAASSRRRGPSAWGAAKPRARAGRAERDFGAARHVPLASPLVQEEGGRRLGAPSSRGLGRGVQCATSGRLDVFLSLRR